MRGLLVAWLEKCGPVMENRRSTGSVPTSALSKFPERDVVNALNSAERSFLLIPAWFHSII
jgi:hypothetical protein